MKNLAVLAFAGCVALPALARTDVAVSIDVVQPGVYGRINIGDVPRPALILPQPVVIAQPRVVVERAPIYLYVPPAHRMNWRHYCGYYRACGQPVYFVQEEWVRERYEHEHPGWHDNRGKHGKHGHGRSGGGSASIVRIVATATATPEVLRVVVVVAFMPRRRNSGGYVVTSPAGEASNDKRCLFSNR